MAIEEGFTFIGSGSDSYGTTVTPEPIDNYRLDKLAVIAGVNNMIVNIAKKNEKVIDAILKEQKESRLQKLQEELLEEKIALAREQRQAVANKNYLLNTEEGALRRGYLNDIAKAGFIPTPAVEGEEYSAF
nr:MAG TPA: hypothetical protein [Caudoviricetes sp.]